MSNWIYKWLAARMVERRLAKLATVAMIERVRDRSPYKIGR